MNPATGVTLEKKKKIELRVDEITTS